MSLHGTDEPPVAARAVHAGRPSFELDDGAIRHVRADGTEVLRGVAFLVRDAAWGTVAATLAERHACQRHRSGSPPSLGIEAGLIGVADYAELTKGTLS